MKEKMKCVITILYALQYILLLAEPLPNVADSTIDKLESEIKSVQEGIINKMPDQVRKDVLNAINLVSIYDIPKDSQEWIDRHVSDGVNERVAKCFELLSADLKLTGDKLGVEDCSMILDQAFFARVRKSPFNLKEKILYYANYWREHSTPNVRLSPMGQGEIDWLWQLHVDERPEGVLHVGLDRKKRTFICYERSVGLYFPEGDTMERIYCEIVQDPNMAGEFIGKNRLKSR